MRVVAEPSDPTLAWSPPDPGTELPGSDPVPEARASVRELIARFAALFWTFSIVWFTFFALVPALVGWAPTVVTSGSMEPSVGAGTVVHIDDGVDLQTVGPGAIITYRDPAIAEMRVTHRVVQAITDDNGTVVGFRTKGDANTTIDSMAVPIEDVEGVARLVLPYAGMPKLWAENGNWLVLGSFVVITALAGVVALDTLYGFVTGSTMSRRRGRGSAIALVLALALGAPSSEAVLAAATDDSRNDFEMSSSWYLDSIDRDTPVAHWRLDDVGTPATTVFTDDFEAFAGYNTYGAGNFVSSNAQARSGTRSGLKTGNNDPNGGWKLLPSVVNGSFEFEVWVYRPSGFLGGSIDRLGLEDASFNGYTFNVDHNGNSMSIDRRTAGSPTRIGTRVGFNPPEDAWYRLELVKTGSFMTLSAYDGGGTLLVSTTATDSTNNSFDRLAIHGGWDYYVDDLEVRQIAGSETVAVDRIGTLDGSYIGNPTVGEPSLLTNVSSTSVAFDGAGDGVLLADSPVVNGTTRDARTAELWFSADTLTGRQVLYEEGGGTNGLNIYLDGNTLYGRAWSGSTGWSNDLQVTATATAATVTHVAVVLDATGARSLTMYVNGVAVGTSTKTDAAAWNAHSDDGAIGRVNGGTEFHDGNSSTAFPFAGRVDEVVLFNSALGAQRIANHYRAGA